MERLTKRGFNFTADFIKRDVDSWSIAQALNKLQNMKIQVSHQTSSRSSKKNTQRWQKSWQSFGSRIVGFR